MVPVHSIEQNECPVSLITPEAENLVTEILAAENVKTAMGAVVYGMDSSKWPSRWFDAVRLAEGEERQIENAIEITPPPKQANQPS